MATSDDQLQQMLQNAANQMGQGGAAAQQLAQALSQLSAQTVNQTSAATVAQQTVQQLNQRTASLSQSIGTMIGAASGFVTSLTSVASSVYGADKAFTSVIPTLDAVSSTFSKVLTAFGQMGSGVSAFGFSFGRASEAVAGLAATAVDAVTGLLRFQLETSQKMADAAIEVSKSGANLGGSITALVNDISDLGVPFQSFQRMLTANAEDINKLGLGMRKGAVHVAGMSQIIVDTNDKLLSLYGNFDAVAKAVAEYSALQSQLGIDVAADFKNQKVGAQEFLMRQRELTAITGKQAELLKKEEEGRRKQLDYNLKLGRLGETARQNVQEGMAVAGKIFGDQGAKYAEEYFATGGKIFSKEALTYQAMNAEAADAIANLMGTVDQSREGFRKGYGDYLKANAGSLEAAARSAEDLAEINRAANNPILKSMAETGSSIVENLKLIQNATSILKDIEQERIKDPVKGDPATQAFIAATRELQENQRILDKQVLTNMQNMTELVGMLNQVTRGFLQGQQDTIEAFRKLVINAEDAGKAMGELAKLMIDRIRNSGLAPGAQQPVPPPAPQQTTPQPVQPNTSQQPQQPTTGQPASPGSPANTQPQTPQPAERNQPNRAEGGLALGPTTVGENGTEAVIPLKGGAVPINIDLSELVNILSQNNALTQEMIDALEDVKDIQERILTASY